MIDPQKPLSPAEAAKLLMQRRALRKDFASWCEVGLSDFNQKPAPHHRFMAKYLEGVNRGDIDRLMIQMPPGHAKSTYGSVLFPPYFMHHHPGAQLIAASAGSSLAEDFAGKVLGLIEDHGPALGYSFENHNRELFYTTNRCRFKSTGVGGKIAGSRADLIVVDDPFGGRKEADSEIVRDATYDWFRGDLMGRLKPGGRVILIMTRWHEDDLAGRLLMDNGSRWTILKLPAIAEEDDIMGRAPGELLWPDYYTPEVMAEKRREAGEREWAAQYQQRPAPASGVMFEIDKLTVAPAVPAKVKRIRFWDLAASEKIGSRDPDYTVGVKLALTEEKTLIVEDVKRVRGGPETVERLICQTAAEDGPAGAHRAAARPRPGWEGAGGIPDPEAPRLHRAGCAAFW